MIKECREIFKNELLKNPNLIFDTYLPANGTYIVIRENEDGFEELYRLDINNKKDEIDRSDLNFLEICKLDYYSRIVDMNKPIEGKKIVQSMNCFSFFVKKESFEGKKLNNERIEEYFSKLKNPYLKYKDKKSLNLYKEVEEEIGAPDINFINKFEKWIRDNVFSLDYEKRKDYLKIFVLKNEEDYKREYKRYTIPNIYNKNDFNLEIENNIYGLSNNNMGMNSKKPYLENKTRKSILPRVLNSEEVLLEGKFFDYLLNLCNYKNKYIYLNEDGIKAFKNYPNLKDNFNGYFLYIAKGKKEAEINDIDILVNFTEELKGRINIKNIFEDNYNENLYKAYEDLKSIENIFNEYVFSKYLVYNYKTESKDIKPNVEGVKVNILKYRDLLFNWFYKGKVMGIKDPIDNLLLSSIKTSMIIGLYNKARAQMAIKEGIKEYFGGESMADKLIKIKQSLREKINNKEKLDIYLENDAEYYFAIGQVVNFFLNLTKSNNKELSFINPILNSRNNEKIKDILEQLFRKYNYALKDRDFRFKKLYSLILGYEAEGKVDSEFIIAGYLSNGLIYEKLETENKDINKNEVVENKEEF